MFVTCSLVFCFIISLYSCFKRGVTGCNVRRVRAHPQHAEPQQACALLRGVHREERLRGGRPDLAPQLHRARPRGQDGEQTLTSSN